MKSPKQSLSTLTPEQFVDNFLENIKIDLSGTCCTNEECDGWHPIQDEDDKKVLETAKKYLLKWYNAR